MQHDQVAPGPERHEGVRPGGNGLPVHRESLHAGSAQAVRGHEDPLGVDEAAGERDADERDASRAVRGHIEAERPPAVLDTGERAPGAGVGNQVPLRITDLGDAAESLRAQRQPAGCREQTHEHAPFHSLMVAQDRSESAE